VQTVIKNAKLKTPICQVTIHHIIRNIRKQNLAEVFMFMPDKIIHQSPHLDKIHSIQGNISKEYDDHHR
jgi:hypothetical protein